MSTVYESNLSSTGGQIFSDDIWRFQSFTPQVSHNIYQIRLSLSRGTIPIGKTFTLSIRLTVAGLPVGGDLCSYSLASDDFPTSGSSADGYFIMSPVIQLVAGTMYAMVLRCSATTGDGSVTSSTANNNFYTRGDEGYSVDGGGTWTANLNDDWWFEEYGNPLSVNEHQIVTGLRHIYNRKRYDLEISFGGVSVVDDLVTPEQALIAEDLLTQAPVKKEPVKPIVVPETAPEPETVKTIFDEEIEKKK